MIFMGCLFVLESLENPSYSENLAFSEFFSVYPKVKVRDHGRGDEEEEESLYYKQRDSYLNSSDLRSYSSVSEQEEDSQTFVAKIPKIYVPGVILSPISTSEEKGKHCRRVDRGVKPEITTSPILRPRAVISSPDNDEMIGNINRSKMEGAKALKIHNQTLNRHSQCKHVHRGDHIETQKAKDADSGLKIGHTVSKSSKTTFSNQRGNSRGSKTKISKTLSP